MPTTPSSESVPDVDRRIAHGAAWMILYKLLDRAVALVSVVILARLLLPDDFGVMALAMSVIATLELIGAFGLDVALIQRAGATRIDFDAAWTVNVVTGLVLASITALAAYSVAHAYGDPRLVAVLLLLAAARAIQGFENAGVIAFRKELQFRREFVYMLGRRLATSILVTLPLAFVLRNYWALLLGNLVGTCIAVGLSYVLHPFRPRISTAGIGSLMRVSGWLLVANAAEVLHQRASDLVVGRMAGISAVGMLAMSRELARIPRELAAPVHRAAFPGYVKLADDPRRLRAAYLRVLGALMLLVFPGSCGLSILAARAVPLVLGPQWQDAIPLVQWLAINGAIAVLLSTAHNVILASGHTRTTTLLLLANLAIALCGLGVLVPALGVLGAPLAVLTASGVMLPLYATFACRVTETRPLEFASVLIRPLFGTAAMAIVLVPLNAHCPATPGIAAQVATLLYLSLAGAATYALAMYAMWCARRDPASADAWLWIRADALRSAAVARMHRLGSRA